MPRKKWMRKLKKLIRKISQNETPDAKWKIKDPRTWKEWCLTNSSGGECVDNDPFVPSVEDHSPDLILVKQNKT